MLNLFLAAFLTGILTGYLIKPLGQKTEKFREPLMNVLLFFILFGMGIKLGSKSLLKQFVEIGISSLLLAFATALGSIILVFAGKKLFAGRRERC